MEDIQHKSGDPSSALNYRPISLLPLISKILERIIHSRLIIYLQTNRLLSSCQYGFRPCSSTQEALLSVSNYWHLMLSNHRQVASIFFDVKKAFNSVPHDKLIRSLAHIGVCGPLLQWLTDYPQNRHQRVVLDGESSSLVSVSSGVPQGSILGPLLFIIFMNSYH